MPEPVPVPESPDSGTNSKGGAPSARRLLALLAPPLAYLGIIFYLSAQSRPLPFLPGTWLSYDKLLHALEYAGLAFLFFRALRGLGVRPGYALLAAALAASLYGATDEWHQSFVPHRSCDPADWAADSAGAFLGAWLGSVLLQRRRGQASILA